MTRLQALNRAIRALSGDAGNTETVEKLRELRDDLPLNHWSDPAIRDAVDQFVLDHKHAPTVTDFRSGSLPSHTVIRNTYGIPLARWLSENYPQERQKPEKARKAYIQDFKLEYFRLKPHTSRGYNMQRNSSSKSWQTIARYQNVSCWGKLLESLHLPAYPKKQETHGSKLTVTVYTDGEEEPYRAGSADS